MRGAVSLAAALALPADFPARDELLFITFGVIFATLVLQGLTLPWVIRWAGLHDDEPRPARSCSRAAPRPRRRWSASRSSRPSEWTRDDTLDRMRQLYEFRTRRFAVRAGEEESEEDIESRSRRYQKVVRQVLDAQRAAIVRLRNSGEISNDVMHRIERELDLEDERLEI